MDLIIGEQEMMNYGNTEGIRSRFIFGEWVVINPNNNKMKFMTQFKFD